MIETKPQLQMPQHIEHCLQNGDEFQIELLEEESKKVVFYNAQRFFKDHPAESAQYLELFHRRGTDGNEPITRAHWDKTDLQSTYIIALQEGDGSETIIHSAIVFNRRPQENKAFGSSSYEIYDFETDTLEDLEQLTKVALEVISADTDENSNILATIPNESDSKFDHLRSFINFIEKQWNNIDPAYFEYLQPKQVIEILERSRALLYRRHDITGGVMSLFLRNAMFITERSFYNVPSEILVEAKMQSVGHVQEMRANEVFEHGIFSYVYDIDHQLLEQLIDLLMKMRSELGEQDTTETLDRHFVRLGFVKKPKDVVSEARSDSE